jgi:hypothetical protein
MKILNCFIILMFLAACTERKGNENSMKNSASEDTILNIDTAFHGNHYNWQQNFGLTHDPEVDSIWGKPVKYYLENPKCSPIAIDFYTGAFRPSDDSTTAGLLALVITQEDDLRPFYRWCLNKTIQIQDGALSEYTGVPARQYAERYPKEFFEYMDIDTTMEKYKDWVGAIAYSGFYDFDENTKPEEMRKRLLQTMNGNCSNCGELLYMRIRKFAMDCFP